MKFIELVASFNRNLIVKSNPFLKKKRLAHIVIKTRMRYEICLWVSVFTCYLVLNFLQFPMFTAVFELFPFSDVRVRISE